ncbi:ankyrin 2,3/unc44 [Achlya hypogyna]|uniref:Ankyrin 2,3/unc44 n=1 Tax=Achlya hypogyna TaxID=1202772 RepID=A0A1V9ZHY4_ACHHY|nr:ankyrin 2,3/unc44 [Achlya hypogyna]
MGWPFKSDDSKLRDAAKDGCIVRTSALLQAGADVGASDWAGDTALHKAAEKGQAAVITLLLQAGADPNRRNIVIRQTGAEGITMGAGRVPLHYATLYGHTHAVAALLQGRTPADYATLFGDAPTAPLEGNADPSATSSDGETALHWAARHRFPAIVAALIQYRVDVNVANERGKMALDIAAKRGFDEIVSVLLAAGASVHHASVDAWTPLHQAAQSGNDSVVARILTAGAEVDAANKVDVTPTKANRLMGGKDGDTPLHVAARLGFEGVVAVLVQHQANTYLFNYTGKTALALAKANTTVYFLLEDAMRIQADDDAYRCSQEEKLLQASQYGDERRVAELLASGVEPNSFTSARTALHWGAANGHAGIVAQLLDAGADTDPVQPSNGWTPLAVAAAFGHTHVVARLLESYASIYQTDNDGNTPLLLAASHGANDVVVMLLQAQSDIRAVNQAGNTALHLAAESGQAQVVATMLAAAAPLHDRNNAGDTALQLAIRGQHGPVVTLLAPLVTSQESTLAEAVAVGDIAAMHRCLQGGLHIDQRTKVCDANVQVSGQTLLLLAIECGQVAMVNALLQAFASVDQPGSDGATPLEVACASGDEAIIALLLANGADANARQKDGHLLLHRTIAKGTDAVIALLLKHRADVDAIDASGQTPLHLSVANRRPMIAASLLAYGADSSVPDAVRLNVPAPQTTSAGDTPLVLAMKTLQADLAQLLYEHSAASPADITVDELEQEQRIRAGGQGIVNKATYKGATVAVKSVLHDLEAPSLRDECNLLRQCASPFILPLLGVVDDGASLQLVLPFMDAGNLRDYLDATKALGEVPMVLTTLQIAWAVAQALVHLHDRRLMHRDLKSENVLLCTKHYIKVADLGSARATDTATMTQAVGTLSWIAPEVFNGGKYDHSADVYSFGVLLTELETQQRPYWDSDLRGFQLTDAIRAGSVRPTLSPTCALWYKELTEACLAFDPEQRPTAADIVRLIEAQAAATSS